MPRLRILVLALAIALVGMLASGQLGTGYSPHPHYRAQVHAFLHGRLALTEVPEGIGHDLAWTDTGVHQVWGLAVPAWQTPFELVGRVFGISPVPDRIAMLAWLTLMLAVLIRGARLVSRTWWEAAGVVLLLAGLPAFLTLMRGSMRVYEEAACYAYAAGVMLVASVLAFVQRPTARSYVVIATLAGLGGLLRPTVWFYSIATIAVLTVVWLRRPEQRARWRVVALGAVLFVAGGALLYATNARRFGAGGEFGHRLNIHSLPGNVVATRFSYPFQREDLADAAAELAGGLFDRPELRRGRGYYLKDLHAGQQPTARWREYYFTTYRWSYVPLLVAGLALAALAWRRGGDPVRRWLGVWAVLGLAPLVWFYLWSPSLSSRYQLDLAPGFAALLVILWRSAAAQVVARIGRARRIGTWLLPGVLLSGWAATQVYARPQYRRADKTITAARAQEVALEVTHPVRFLQELPDEYDRRGVATFTDVPVHIERCWDEADRALDCSTAPSAGDRYVRATRDELGWHVVHHVVGRAPGALTCEADDATTALACEAAPAIRTTALPINEHHEPRPLYLNGSGWDLDSGRVPPATHFYVEAPTFVELEVSYAPVTARAASYQLDWTTAVRVAAGLHHLKLASVEDLPDGARLRFVPTRPLPGLQVLFIAFGSDELLDAPASDFLLHRVRWR